MQGKFHMNSMRNTCMLYNTQWQNGAEVSHEFNMQHMYVVCITLSHRVVLKYEVCATAHDVHVPDIPENYALQHDSSGLNVHVDNDKQKYGVYP